MFTFLLLMTLTVDRLISNLHHQFDVSGVMSSLNLTRLRLSSSSKLNPQVSQTDVECVDVG